MKRIKLMGDWEDIEQHKGSWALAGKKENFYVYYTGNEHTIKIRLIQEDIIRYVLDTDNGWEFEIPRKEVGKQNLKKFIEKKVNENLLKLKTTMEI